MKKILFIIILICLAIIVRCQTIGSYDDLPAKTTYSGTDGLTIMSGGIPYKMTANVFNGPLLDSLDKIRDTIDNWYTHLLYTAGNGLTLSSQEFLLGGNVTNHVSFIGDGTKDFLVGQSGYELRHINLYADNNIILDGDNIYMDPDGVRVMDIDAASIKVDQVMYPGTTKTHDLGLQSNFYDDAYLDRVYVDTVAAYIDVTGTGSNMSMTLTSPASGTVDLLDVKSTIDSIPAHNTRILALEAGGGTTYTFENGLTESGGTAKLGGSLTGDTYVTGTGASGDLFFRHIETGNYSTWIAQKGYSPIDILVFSEDDFTGYASGLYVDEGIATLQARSSASSKRIALSSTSMLITDAEDSKGLEYYADYSANYTARSIPDSAAVAAMIAAGGGGDLSGIRDSLDAAYAAAVTNATPLDTVAHMLVDTLQFVFGLGAMNAGDTATMTVGAQMGTFLAVQDSIILDSIVAYCFGTGGNIDLQVQYNSNPNYASGTPAHNALSVTTAGGVTGTTTFQNQVIGPGNFIWCEPTTVTAKPTQVVLILLYHEKRAS